MTRLAIWRTGHQIADTVGSHFINDSTHEVFWPTIGDSTFDTMKRVNDAHIAYGILRGTSDIFSNVENWFNIDRGYFNPGHFNGYYRISYKGTQAKWHNGIPQSDEFVVLEDWKNNDNGHILNCPPTNEVMRFFGLDGWWYPKGKIRIKGDTSPIEWSSIRGVRTFNSSVGWQALQRGIPCISDTEHSIVGSYYKHELDKLGLDYNFENVMKIPREPLFRAMKAHQFTLKEIREGQAWTLINHYLQKK